MNNEVSNALLFTAHKNQHKRLVYILPIAAIFVFLILVVGSAVTTRPESDEGSFASPSKNLAEQGFFGTTVFEKEYSTLTRIEQRTYWVMPLFLLNAAASFKVFGFSLFAMRLVSIFWGLVLLTSWYVIALKLSGDKINAALCMLLQACSYVVIITASIGRGDTMCVALGFAAFAIYLSLRERNLLLAIFLAECLVVLSGLTHFLGILAFFGLLFLILYVDFRTIGWKHILIGIIPYLIGGTAFGLWVWQDPQAFKDQFITNAVMNGRTAGLSSPLTGFITEFTVRYPRAFGLLENTAGHSGPIYLKSLALIGYIIGILGMLFSKEIRSNKYFRALLYVTAIYFVLMSLIDGQKLAVYLIYIVPFYNALLSIWFYRAWEKRWLPRSVLLLALSGFILLQTGGVTLRIKQNTLGNYYHPAVEFVNQNAVAGDLIFGGPELRFGLNTPAVHIADGMFGMKTGKRPKFIVYDPGTADSWKDSKVFNPEFYEYFPRLLNEEYTVGYENAAFKVYVHR